MKLAILTAGTFLLSFSAQATPLTFDFTNGGGTDTSASFGNVRTFTMDGLTVTETAFSLTGSHDTTFQSSNLGLWTGYGLGVCNQNEGANCSSPNHQVSNENGTDFVLFQFSSAVDVASVHIQPYGNYYSNATYYTGDTASNLNLTNATLASLHSLGFDAATDSDSSVSGAGRTVGIVSSGAVTSLLFGASTEASCTPDYFKIASLTVDAVSPAPSAAPEPATFGLMGSALLGLALAAKKFRK